MDEVDIDLKGGSADAVRSIAGRSRRDDRATPDPGRSRRRIRKSAPRKDCTAPPSIGSFNCVAKHSFISSRII